MKRKTESEILSASEPRDIFTMNPDTIEQEKEDYLERFKPQAYRTIRNFMVTQKVILLYRQALSQLDSMNNEEFSDLLLTITDTHGNTQQYDCHYVYDIGLGKMHVTEDYIIFVIKHKYKKYYENYIDKTKHFPKLNKRIWQRTEYSLPKVTKHFQNSESDYVIFVEKPCKIYPLREILNYFNGKLKPEYVASILTRLYNFVCYLDLIGMNHNGITIDNLFFAPGRTVEEGEAYTVQDMRIVGVFGGWFFTTWSKEEVIGLPKDVYDTFKCESTKSKYSFFKIDELSIKRVARELLGDVSGENLQDVPESFCRWVNDIYCNRNAYEEFKTWEKVIISSFGKRRFVEMDISID